MKTPKTPAQFDAAVQQTLPQPPYADPQLEHGIAERARQRSQAPPLAPTPTESPTSEIVAPAPASEAPTPSQTETEGEASESATAEAATDTNGIERELAQPRSRAGIQWTPDDKKLALIAAVQTGVGARAAASQVGLNLRTAYGILASMEDDTEALRAATQRLMALGSVDAIDQWRVAMDVGARKKGNHAPARDWLLHAGVIDPLATDSSVNVRVAICIGTEEKPMRIASPLQVPRTQDDTSDD